MTTDWVQAALLPLFILVVSVGEPMSFIKGSLLVQYKLRPVSLISQVNHTGENGDGKNLNRVNFELRFLRCWTICYHLRCLSS